jgi:hypothetical protein
LAEVNRKWLAVEVLAGITGRWSAVKVLAGVEKYGTTFCQLKQ